MRRTLALFLCAVMVTALFAVKTSALTVSAAHVVMIDADTLEVLYSKSADARASVASTTKIMTALVAVESGFEKDVKIKPSHMAEGSSMYLREGETVKADDLLHGLMLMSGNDAALAIADAAGGGITNFVRLMNEKAAEIGMKNTNFENPNGLDGEKHYSTARDMAVLAAYAMKNERFSLIASSKTYVGQSRTMKNHNRLLYECEGVDGVKTGFTKKAGRCLVSSAVRGGKRLVCVTLNAPSDWGDHKRLYDYGFSLYSKRALAKAGEVLFTRPVYSGVKNTVSLVAKDDSELMLSARQAENLTCYDIFPQILYAPVIKSAQAGWRVYTLDGHELHRTVLLYGESVYSLPAKKPTFLEKLLSFFGLY